MPSTSQTLAAQGGTFSDTTRVERPVPGRQQERDLPTWLPDSYRRMAPKVERCRDVFSGTDRMREKAGTYIPKWPQEDDESYRQRVFAAPVREFMQRCIRAFGGLVFAMDPKLGEDVPKLIVDDFEDIDRRGTHGDVFLRRVFEDGLTTGVAGILVDYPVVPENSDATSRLTLADEAERGLRPYWCHFVQEDILQVRWEEDPEGQLVMTLLVLHELVEEDDGLFGTTAKHRWRVYRRWLDEERKPVVTSQVWYEVKTRTKTAISPGPEVRCTCTRIPFALGLFGPEISAVETLPPLLGLADKNIQHWRNDCELQFVLDRASRPTLIIKGANREAKEGELVRVGPDVALHVPKDGDVLWLEFAGASADKLRQQKQDVEREIASDALAFMASDEKNPETATAKRIDAAAQNATLSTAATALEDMAEQALGFHAEYRALAEGGGSIALNRDFEQMMLDPQQVQTLSNMVASDQLTLETMLLLLEMGRWLPAGFDHVRELGKLTQQKEANMATALKIAGGRGDDAADDDDETDDEDETPPNLPQLDDGE